MKKLVLALLILLAPHWALAQTSTQIEAEKLVDTLRLVDNIKANSDTMAVKLIKDKSKNMPPVVQQKMDPLVREELRNSINRSQLEFKSDVSVVLAKHFTTEELRDMNAFFATPTGQKLATQWQPLQPDIEALSKKWSRRVETEVMANVMTRLALGK